MLRAVRYIAGGILVFLVQWFLLGRLKMWGAYPDVVLLFLTLVSIRFGRLVGTSSGFVLGALMDAIYGTWGVNMLAKTIVGFLVGSFPLGEKASINIAPQQAFLGGLLIALFHNGILVICYALQSGTRNMFMIGSLWLGSALYTAVVAMIASLYKKQ